MSFSLRKFNAKAAKTKSTLRRFLSRVERKPPRSLDAISVNIDREVWMEVDCLACANCCRSMTPTYNNADLKRIAAHLGMTVAAFKTKWLRKDRNGDWVNRSTPCQFLNLKDNKCSIYEMRPADCAGFPHLTRKKMVDYIHVHKQNLELCPATHRMVEKLVTQVAALESK